MATSVLPTPSVLTQAFTTDHLPAIPLIRSITEIRWWGGVLYLDENPDMLSVETSMPHGSWTWRLERTAEKFVYNQNTYFDGKLMMSSKMDTRFQGRGEFIAQFFPGSKLKAD
jgi:hypothetical protein